MTILPRFRRNPLLLLLAVPLVAIVFGCQSRAVVKSGDDEPLALEKIVVLPVRNMYATYGEGVNFRCPICSGSFLVGEVAPEAEAFLTQQIYLHLKSLDGVEVVSPEQATGVQSSLLMKSQREPSELELVTDIGRAVGADAVLLGRLYRYAERVGTGYAAESPASVSFSILLVQPGDGSLIWEGHFTETQRALSENLLDIGTFFKRKMKWLTARELALSGLEEVLRTFPVR